MHDASLVLRYTPAYAHMSSAYKLPCCLSLYTRTMENLSF